MARADKVVASTISIGMGYAELTVSRVLSVGMGGVKQAIVFDKVHAGMSNIEDLHCLSSTTQSVGMSGIKKVTFHSKEELVQMATNALGIDLAGSIQGGEVTDSKEDGEEEDVVVVPVEAQLASKTDVVVEK